MASKAQTKARVLSSNRKPRTKLKFFKGVFLLGFVAFTLAAVSGGLYFSSRLAMAAEKVNKLPELIQTGRQGATQIFSADNKLLYESVKEFRDPVSIDDVPEVVQKSILAAEDKRFYSHTGIDPWSLARVLVTNAKEQRVAGGGSTITMQLAKLTFTSFDRTLTRKVDDMALALQIERQLTKKQILELYLNQAYFGQGAYGISAAAKVYFGKKLKNLTLAESAMLARCVRRPSDQNPVAHYDVANDNKNVVLAIMREEGWITREEHEHAKVSKPKLAPQMERDATIRRSPYFVRYVLDELRRMEQFKDVDFENGGYRIETTVDTRLQDTSDSRARRLVKQFRRSGARTAAFVLMNKQGEVLAMTGGIDFTNRQFNAVTQGKRQPGSSFKPFVYTAAFQYQEFTGPYDTISNETYVGRRIGKDWVVQGRGGVTNVRTAIAFSYNAAAVRTMQKVRPEVAVRFANRIFGFELKPEDAVMSLVLGSVAVSPLEMAEAYTVFQNYGERRVTPYAVKRVIGPDNQVLYAHSPGENVTELRETSRTAFSDIDSCMRAVVTQGTAANFASSVRNARGKTGTTNDNRDAWFCGYTNDFIGVGWVSGEIKDEDGRIRYIEMGDNVMGGTVTVRMWRDVVLAAQALLGESNKSGLGLGNALNAQDDEPIRESRPRRQREEEAPVEDTTSPRIEDSQPSPDEPEPDLPDDPAPRPSRTRTKPEQPKPDPAPKPTPAPDNGLPDGPEEPSFNDPNRGPGTG